MWWVGHGGERNRDPAEPGSCGAVAKHSWTKELQRDRFSAAEDRGEILRRMEPIEWRLVIDPSGPADDALLQRLASAAGDHLPRGPHDGSICLYSAHEAAARRAFQQAASEPGVRQAQLARFDAVSEEWLTVDRSAPKAAQSGNQTHAVSRITPRHIAFAAAVIVLNVAAYLFMYYVPAGEYAPAAGHEHEVGWAIFTTLLCDALGGGCYLFVRRKGASGR
jgi:hypothetical protein